MHKFRGRQSALQEAEALQKQVAEAAQASGLSPSALASDLAFIRAVTDFSDIMRLAKTDQGFRPAASDKARNIFMYTMPVTISPVHMMKATATMPCTPREFLQWLELENRPVWDDHFITGSILGETPSFLKAMELAYPPRRSTAAGNDAVTPQGAQVSATGGAATPAVSKKSLDVKSLSNVDELASKTRPPSQGPAVSSQGTSVADVDTVSNAGSELHGAHLSSLNGRPSVWLKHMAWKSPVPLLVQRRDFEFIAAEHTLPDGTAVLKAMSPQIGRVRSPVHGFVRGVIEVSGFVAEPVGKNQCRVTYVALVDPMGLVPPPVVNAVVGKQTSTLAQLQHAMSQGRPKPVQSTPGKSHHVQSPDKVAPSKAQDSTSLAGRLRAHL
jgi:hypothetical protein